MKLEEVLLYTKAALKDACFAKSLIEEIPKFIQNQEMVIALYEHNIEYKERCIFNLQDENRRLRYELAMAKAYMWRYAYTNRYTYGNCYTYGFWFNGFIKKKVTKKYYKVYREQWLRIAEAYEARARKIKEESI